MAACRLQNLDILYVEDDELTRENTLEILNRKCRKVSVAKDGIEGYELYQLEKPNIIITDIQMPRMDGITMAKKIRRNDFDTLIIITTAYTDQKYLLDAVELQLIKYITKPLTWDKISSALEASLRHIKEEPQLKFYLDKSTYFDLSIKTLYTNHESIYLTNHETQLLTLLCQNANNPVAYSKIEHTVWQDEGMSSNAIKSLTKGLRKKLPENSIDNLYGIGYILKAINTHEKK